MNIDLNKKLPGYLTEKGNMVTHILFTAGFSLLFLNLYTPFGAITRGSKYPKPTSVSLYQRGDP